MNITKVLQTSKGEMKIEFMEGWDEFSMKTPDGLSEDIRIAQDCFDRNEDAPLFRNINDEGGSNAA